MQGNKKGFISPPLLLIVLAVVAIVLIVVFLMSSQNEQAVPGQVSAPTDSVVENLNNLSQSDSVSDIEKDVNQTDLSQVDQGVDQIDADARDL